MSEHNTQLPTCVELSGKQKWEVRRRWSDFYDNHSWEVIHPDGFVDGDFNTWREAMEWADKEARTIEVTLPRQDYTDPQGEPRWWINDILVTPAFDGSPDRTMISTHPRMSVSNTERVPLALALLALHYQQEGQA